MGFAIEGPPVAHDAEGDAWRERCAAATLPAGDSPPWRSNYLACAAWPASSSWNALHRRPRRAVPAAPGLPRASRQRRTQRRAMQFGARMKMRWYPTAAGHAPRARRCGRSPAARSTLSPMGANRIASSRRAARSLSARQAPTRRLRCPAPTAFRKTGQAVPGMESYARIIALIMRDFDIPGAVVGVVRRRRRYCTVGTPSTRLPGGPATISSHGSVRWTPFWFPAHAGIDPLILTMALADQALPF